MYNVLIVDDEFLARKLLINYVEKIEGLSIVGTAANASEAFAMKKTNQVDIMLLDIHMPDLNGLDFAKTCTDVPAIIFTTAYSEYALEGFEVDAVDYLLKPIAFPRFEKAIEKAKAKINGLKKEPATEAETPEVPGKDFMLVKADYKIYKIKFADLLYIEGQHEYVSFYTKEKRITALYSLKNLEEELPQDLFVRVQKSYIVSLKNISEIDSTSVTVAGVKIPVGGSYRENFLRKVTHTT